MRLRSVQPTTTALGARPAFRQPMAAWAPAPPRFGVDSAQTDVVDIQALSHDMPAESETQPSLVPPNGHEPGKRSGNGDCQRNGSATQAAAKPRRHTGLAAELGKADIKQVAGELVLYAMIHGTGAGTGSGTGTGNTAPSAPSPLPPYTLYWRTTSSAITEQLQQMVRMHQNDYICLSPDDVDVIVQRLASTNQLRKALSRLEQSGWITLVDYPSKGNTDLSIQIIRPLDQFRYSRQTGIEPILIQNLAKYLQVARHLGQHIQAGQIAPGQVIPTTLSYQGKHIARSTRAEALEWLLAHTQLLRKARNLPTKKPTKGVKGLSTTRRGYVVRMPDEADPAPERRAPYSAMAALLYDLNQHGYLGPAPPAKPLPTDRALKERYGNTSKGYYEAKQQLIALGLVERNSPGSPIYRLKQAPTPQQLATLVVSGWAPKTQYLHQWLTEVTPDSVAMKRWQPVNTMADCFPLPDTMGQRTRERKIFNLIAMLNEAPIPFVCFNHEASGSKRAAWVNPSLNLKALQAAYQAMMKDPAMLVTANAWHFQPWQVPKLYEGQSWVIPTFRRQPHDDHTDVSMGLLRCIKPGQPFESLNNLPAQTQPNPLPNGPADAHTKQPDLRHYAQRCLERVLALYDAPDLSTLETEAVAHMPTEQADTLWTLKAPLETLGYRFQTEPATKHTPA
ncbi:MAG: hypothetical protein KC475_11885 [Cyanobacteria bacterium HKST-UBA03]|nr:hypothetical protein [Cyanobacteria bacterium HKST-UBA03]